MTITARFKSTCSRCHQSIQAGEEIDYDRNSRTASHLDCEPQAAAELPDRHGVDWHGQR
jgi:hypothetical protein